MRILVLGLNYAPEPIGIAVYTTGLCEALAAAGHQVSVVAARPYYPAWRIDPSYRGRRRRRERVAGVDIRRVPLYVPARPTGAKRILHHLSFAAAALLPTLVRARRLRPHLVFTVAPSLASAPVAALAARVAGARSWLHIQDFEVEAAVATGLLDPRSRVTRLASGLERRIVRRFDRVSSIGPEMCARLETRMGVARERIVELRNWSDVDRIAPLAGPSLYRSLWRIDRPHVALYAGNIAMKQGIGIVLDAARRLRHRRDLLFVICGEGPTRAELEAKAADLDNISFQDLQPADRLGDLLGLASVHLLPQRADAADLVLPSKLVNMLASGRPVVATAAPGTGLRREVEGCGIVTAPGDADRFAEAIVRLIDDRDARDAFGAAARRRAEERWAPRAIIGRFESAIGELIGSSGRLSQQEP